MKVGHVDSDSVGCAMYFSGCATMRSRNAARSALLAAGPDEHAVAAGAVDFLDHELGKMLQAVREFVGFAQLPGRHVVEDRLLGQIEPDHLGHERIDRLVVGNAGADGVGQRHLAGAVRRKQSRNADHRIGAEGFRIQEIVVDAAIKHVYALRTPRGAHVHRVVLDEKVLAFDELDAHLLRQERMLEVRRVVCARREHRHFGLLGGGRDGPQVFQ